MIRPRIQINNSRISDIFNKFGFIYLDSDKRTAADESEYETISFPEKDGEEIDTRVRLVPFDYKIRFVVEAPNRNTDNVNSKIQRFNELIRMNRSDDRLARMREITLYNDYDRVKIVGYPKLISVPEEIFHSHAGELDFAVFTLEIHVSHPEKCNFATKGKDEMPIEIKLHVDQNNTLMLETSKTLESDEYIFWLRKGRSVSGGIRQGNKTNLRSNGWHLNREIASLPFDIECTPNNKTYILTPNANFPKWEVYETKNKRKVVRIKKSQRNRTIIPYSIGKEIKVQYGLAIGKRSAVTDGRIERLSNVRFFYVNCKIDKEEGDDSLLQWIST